MISVDAMRAVDRYLGVPACWLLTLLRLAARPFTSSRLPAARKVLIVKLSEMGSTVLAYPVIESLRQNIPGLELFFVTFASNRALLDTITPPQNVFAIDVSSFPRMLSSTLSILAALRRRGIDSTLDMDFFSRFSAILAFLVCRGNRVGFHRFTSEGLGRGRLLTHPVLYSAHVHTAAAFLSLSRALLAADPLGLNTRSAIHPEDLHIPLHKPDPAAIDAVRRRLRSAGIDDASRIILLNPNSSDLFPLRRWPLDRFAELASRLVRNRADVSLVITGTASEQPDAAAIVDRAQSARCVSFAGSTTFGELLALYSLSSALVTNDSGPAHFATLLRLPTVVLFGPETPVLYGPLNANARCLHRNFACSPCVSVYNAKKSPCTRSLCLEAISVDEVLGCLQEILTAAELTSSSPRPSEPRSC